MNVIEIPRRPEAPARRPHTRLAVIDPRARGVVRASGSVTGIPGRPSARPITFDSAL
ncbi:hypothetical protein ACIBAC_11565 [Streptomyces sp. NPDC051362]|uniref:hypothetical protein n=1 Tax=Streptomyces sp. NPDC051362 TaxID=3365651 RepID=UPI0037AE6CC5